MKWLLCAIGLHDWDEFGECRRNWKHVQTYPGEMLIGVGHLLRGREWTGGPWTRVAARRYEADKAAGLALQAQIAQYTEEPPTLEMCRHVAKDPDLARAIVEVAKERTAVAMLNRRAKG